MDLRIREIAEACGGRLVIQSAVTEETAVDSVVLDSRRLTAGGVFVATVGERVDGHQFIPGVFGAGAALVVTEKTPQQVEAECDVPAAEWGNYLLVEDSFQALKDMAEYYRRKLQIPIVGITGSVGKTSTKEFIAGVLAEKYKVLKTEGNFNNEIGVPLTLLRIRGEHEAAVVEMGISDFGEMRRLSKMVRPDICVITNIGQCHLENLGTRDGILKAKTEIFDYMPERGEVCLNGEDDRLRTLTEIILGSCLESGGGKKKPHFFGLGNFDCEEVYADSVESRGLWGSDAAIHMTDVSDISDEFYAPDGAERERAGEGGAAFPVKIPLPGAHMVINGAAAACVAKLLGLNQAQIAEGLRKLQPVDGRNNLLRLGRYTIIDDCYNANPVSMKASIDLLAMADTRKVAILGDMFELGENSDALHAEVGAYAAQSGADCIICVGENARHLYAGAIGAENCAVRDGAAACAARGEQSVLYFKDRAALMESLKSRRDALTPEGCTILVKASHGMEFAKVVEYLREE